MPPDASCPGCGSGLVPYTVGFPPRMRFACGTTQASAVRGYVFCASTGEEYERSRALYRRWLHEQGVRDEDL